MFIDSKIDHEHVESCRHQTFRSSQGYCWSSRVRKLGQKNITHIRYSRPQPLPSMGLDLNTGLTTLYEPKNILAPVSPGCAESSPDNCQRPTLPTDIASSHVPHLLSTGTAFMGEPLHNTREHISDPCFAAALPVRSTRVRTFIG
jgi:hypothetical protein